MVDMQDKHSNCFKNFPPKPPFRSPKQSVGNFQVVHNSGFAVKIQGIFKTTKV